MPGQDTTQCGHLGGGRVVISLHRASTVTPRNSTDGPFCWQSKGTLRRIAEACDDRTDRAHVLAVYLALSWLASDKQEEVFAETKARIAERAGVSYRKAAGVLSFLERVGVIGVAENFITGSKERGPNTYTLGTPCTGSGTPCPRLGTDAKQATVPRLLEESPEESIELAPAGAAVESGKASTKPGPKPRKPRKRNPLLDALAAIGGADPAQVTGKAWGGIGAALKEISEVCPGVTVEEINRRAGHYRQHMPGAMLTAHALAKHWATCDRPPPSAQATPQPARNYKPFTT